MARAFGVSLATVQLWLERAGTRRLERVDWGDRPSVPQRQSRTERSLEDLILGLRTELRASSVLGEYGAAAIRRELQTRELSGPVPTERTIGRILERRGALDAGRRVRRLAPAPGWYLPDLAARRVELDSFDIVDGLYLKGSPELGILTAISLPSRARCRSSGVTTRSIPPGPTVWSGANSTSTSGDSGPSPCAAVSRPSSHCSTTSPTSHRPAGPGDRDVVAGQ